MTIKAEIRQEWVMGDGPDKPDELVDFLYVNNRPLHWDTSLERAGQAEMVKDARGDVLVAGYGLGISQRILMDNPKVTSVVTVEKYKAVIDVCFKRDEDWHGGWVVMDIWDFLKDERYDRYYDTIIGDIWSGSIAADAGQYKRFRKAAARHLKPGGQILMGPRDV